MENLNPQKNTSQKEAQDIKELEYNNFIKSSVADGSYFKDAVDWYIFRYVHPICERTIIFIIAIFAGFVAYCLSTVALESLPIKEDVPVIIRARDQSQYFPVIKKLKDSVEVTNIDEAIVKYLVIEYVKKRENYDFRKDNLLELRSKLDYIKNNSSPQEYANFQNFLSKNNKYTPLNYFDLNFQRKVEISSFMFVRQKTDNLIDGFKEFLITQIPQEIIVRYKVKEILNSREISDQKHLVKIKFNFSTINSRKSAYRTSRIDFLITDYKIDS